MNFIERHRQRVQPETVPDKRAFSEEEEIPQDALAPGHQDALAPGPQKKSRTRRGSKGQKRQRFSDIVFKIEGFF